ncbi:copper homeostasis protein CutC [Sphingomonas sp. ASV193]|uniref:copper homeostasis protein CutC n=1 Tax=Sphingomonas sp. ASV193 TaxID=3144405 RepID=UPI0032E8A45D
MLEHRIALEICVDSPAGIAAAVAGGADRLELCDALETGGLTPSPGLVRHGLESGRAAHAMIRPRTGGFVYDEDELAAMLVDAAALRDAGVTGVVIGAAKRDGTLDLDAIARLRDEAGPGMKVVLHRVIDLVPDRLAAVDQACALGLDGILSSGGALGAPDGAEMLARMVRVAGDRLWIMAGAGVRADNVRALVEATGVVNVHGSASKQVGAIDPDLARLGFQSVAPRTTDRDEVARIRAILDSMGAAR